MQLMWVAGPTGKVHTISITKRKVLISFSVSAFVMMTIGFLFYLVGFKFAIQTHPELARTLGGVTTQAEQNKMESVYRARLVKLQSVLDSTARDIQQLEALKNRFMEIATPSGLREKHALLTDGKGGPFIPETRQAVISSRSIVKSFDSADDEFDEFQKGIKSRQQDWSKQLIWLHTLPTAIPIGGEFQMSSGFGVRNDPFTGIRARHEGLDFTASTGTPILAAADGTVTRSGWESTYGNIVEISHAEGFVTRYAHISKRLAQEGQKVKRGEMIAEVGSTGRSTGPHLHYEVFRFGQVLNPVHVLPNSDS